MLSISTEARVTVQPVDPSLQIDASLHTQTVARSMYDICLFLFLSFHNPPLTCCTVCSTLATPLIPSVVLHRMSTPHPSPPLCRIASHFRHFLHPPSNPFHPPASWLLLVQGKELPWIHPNMTSFAADRSYCGWREHDLSSLQVPLGILRKILCQGSARAGSKSLMGSKPYCVLSRYGQRQDLLWRERCVPRNLCATSSCCAVLDVSLPAGRLDVCSFISSFKLPRMGGVLFLLLWSFLRLLCLQTIGFFYSDWPQNYIQSCWPWWHDNVPANSMIDEFPARGQVCLSSMIIFLFIFARLMRYRFYPSWSVFLQRVFFFLGIEHDQILELLWTNVLCIIFLGDISLYKATGFTICLHLYQILSARYTKSRIMRTGNPNTGCANRQKPKFEIQRLDWELCYPSKWVPIIWIFLKSDLDLACFQRQYFTILLSEEWRKRVTVYYGLTFRKV